MTTLRANTALAAEIARVDRQRFNEAVAADFYPCAPETIAGRSRSFGLDDLVVLFIYGRLLDEGVIPRRAGEAACRLLTYFREMAAVGEDWTDLNRITHVVFDGQPLTSAWVRPERIKADTLYLDGREIISARTWHLKLIRERIVDRLHQEDGRRVLGPIEVED